MDQIKRLLGALSVRQRWTIAIAVVLGAAGIYSLANWQREANFRPLYNALAPEDASVVVQKLKESGTPYRISNNGTTISVPEEKVAELRLEMAGAGVPKSGRIGFEIFDKTNFGMTDFAEHVNYRRALEGELERSVMSVAEDRAGAGSYLPAAGIGVSGRTAAGQGERAREDSGWCDAAGDGDAGDHQSGGERGGRTGSGERVGPGHARQFAESSEEDRTQRRTNRPTRRWSISTRSSRICPPNWIRRSNR